MRTRSTRPWRSVRSPVPRSMSGIAIPDEPGRAAPATRPFHELPNVLMTPHVAGWTDRMLEARAQLIAENIRRMACRETPLHVVE